MFIIRSITPPTLGVYSPTVKFDFRSHSRPPRQIVSLQLLLEITQFTTTAPSVSQNHQNYNGVKQISPHIFCFEKVMVGSPKILPHLMEISPPTSSGIFLMPQFPSNCYDCGDDTTTTHADVGAINVGAGAQTYPVSYLYLTVFLINCFIEIFELFNKTLSQKDV